MAKISTIFIELVQPTKWNTLTAEKIATLTDKQKAKITKAIDAKSNAFLLDHLEAVHQLAPQRLMDIANDSNYFVASRLAHKISPHMVMGNAPLLETLCTRVVNTSNLPPNLDPLLTWHNRTKDDVALFSHKVPMLTPEVLHSLSPAQFVSLLENANEITRGPILYAMDAPLIQTYEALIVKTLKQAQAKHEQKTLRAFVSTLLKDDNYMVLKQTPSLHEAITNESIIRLRPNFSRFNRSYVRKFDKLNDNLKAAGIKSFHTPTHAPKGTVKKMAKPALSPL